MDILWRPGEARRVLVAWQVGVVQGDLAACHHGDFHALVVLEPVEDLLEGHGALLEDDLVVVGVAFGQHRDGAAHDWVKLLRLVLNDVVGLAHHDRWQSQVDEAILELLDLGESLRILVDRSSVEVFTADGLGVISDLAMPDSKKSISASLFAVGGSAIVTNLKIYTLKSAR